MCLRGGKPHHILRHTRHIKYKNIYKKLGTYICISSYYKESGIKHCFRANMKDIKAFPPVQPIAFRVQLCNDPFNWNNISNVNHN